MRNIVEVDLAGDSTGEAQHSGRISDQQYESQVALFMLPMSYIL